MATATALAKPNNVTKKKKAISNIVSSLPTNTIIGQEEAVELLKVAVDNDLPTLLVGETGTGKTSLIRELAMSEGHPYTRFSITGETTVDDFVGKYILKNGETIWQDGILLTAVKDGHFLVVDEINAALPEILFVLHSLLDDDKYVIIPQKDNSTVKPHKNFRFFATMNPVDEYAGTKELNKAFHSRFAMVLDVKYPSRGVEIDIINKRCNVTIVDAQKMVDVAIGLRRAKHEEKIFYTMSTRDLIYWGNLVDKIGIHRAFRVAVKNKGTGDGTVIEELYQKVFTDYKRAEEQKLQTSIEYYQTELSNLKKSRTVMKAALLAEVQKDLKSQSDAIAKEKKTLVAMETKLKEQIRDALDNKPPSLSTKLQKTADTTGVEKHADLINAIVAADPMDELK